MRATVSGSCCSCPVADDQSGIPASDFSRIGNAGFARFTIGRKMIMLAKLDQEVDVVVTTRAHRRRSTQPLERASPAFAEMYIEHDAKK